MSSFDDVIDSIIDAEINSLMFGSHEDQVKFIEKHFNVEIINKYDGWPKFIEIFERRNIVAHGNLVVNDTYIRNCKKHGYDVGEIRKGDSLKFGSEDLSKTTGRLMEFGLLLSFSLWRKHFPEHLQDAAKRINNITFELIKNKRATTASRVLENVLFKQKAKTEDRIHKMMIVNLANAIKKDQNTDRAIEIIEKVDWSATTDDYKICVASIKGDVAEVVRLMEKVVREELVKKIDFKEWPVFDWVKEEPEFKKEFERIFGEPIIEEEREEISDPKRSAG